MLAVEGLDLDALAVGGRMSVKGRRDAGREGIGVPAVRFVVPVCDAQGGTEMAVGVGGRPAAGARAYGWVLRDGGD